MCGLVVVIGHGGVGAAVVRSRLEQMRDRGPDAQRSDYVLGPVTEIHFGHARLAIQAVGDVGGQPMRNEDGDILVFNGEIYNASELNRRFALGVADGQGLSDTQVLLEGLGKLGPGFEQHLQGMYAFVWYSARHDTLFVCRDHCGIKPLYLKRSAEFTEISSIPHTGSGRGRTAISRGQLRHYLRRGYCSQRVAIATGVTAVPSEGMLAINIGAGAHSAEFERHSILSERPANPSAAAGSPSGKSVCDLRGAIAEAVTRNLVSERPSCLFLSGGVDSAAIACCAAQSHQDIEALTVSFKGHGDRDEADAASELSRFLGLSHRVMDVAPSSIGESVLEEFLSSMYLPTVDGLNSWLVSREARRAGYVVALSGTGGDELFGGYPSFERPSWIHRAVGRSALPLAAAWLARKMNTMSATNRIFRSCELLTSAGRADIHSYYDARKAIFSQRFLEMLDGSGTEECRCLEGGVGYDWQEGVSRLEFNHYLRECLLRDIDNFSMRHSLEVRVPLLDQSVVDFVRQMNPGDRFSRADGAKTVLKDAFRDQVSPGYFDRPKQGFTVPLDAWLSGPYRKWAEDLVLWRGSPFNPKGLKKVWQEFMDKPARVGWSRPWSILVVHYLLKNGRLELEGE